MRYHYDEGRCKTIRGIMGITYQCNHPLYSHCTLYLQEERGLAVIQQVFEPSTKHTYWAEIRPWLVDELYLQPAFTRVFDDFAKPKDANDLFPTMTLRQIMWRLRMKPLRREPWETAFDRCPV